MSEKFDSLALVVFIWLCGAACGYVIAHHEVARECSRLGGFYVGGATFECKPK